MWRFRVSVACAGALIAGVAIPGAVAPGSSAADHPARSSEAGAAQAARPVTGLYWNDPRTDSRGAQIQLIRRLNAAAPNTGVRIMAWSVDDPAVIRAVRRAAADRVAVKIIGSPANCKDFRSSFRFLTRDGVRRTWVKCVKRGRGVGMHQKAYLFERTGGVSDVTLIGSANMAEGNWKYQWNDLFQYAGRTEVYRWYVGRFAKVSHNLGRPSDIRYETHTASDGRARVNFFPIDDRSPNRSKDPVWDRLNNLPVNPGGDHPISLGIAMYGMDLKRGSWLVDKLVRMRSNGARIRFIAGPCVRAQLKKSLRRGGVRVANGYEGGCGDLTSNFVHLKAMTARYWQNKEWNYRSYTGSANWNIVGLTGDLDSMHRMGGRDTWRSYRSLLDTIWREYR